MAFTVTSVTSKPPKWFRHNPPEKPAAPVFPDALTADEIIEVRSWQAGWTKYADLTTNAAAKADEYLEHDAAAEAWMTADTHARQAQWDWQRSDAQIENTEVTTESGSDDGTPSDPPPDYIPPHRGEDP